MKIRLLQKECDNGKVTCKDCKNYDCDIITSGCTHPILYDNKGNIIPEIEDLIIDCIKKPRYCILFDKKSRYYKEA